MPTSNYMPAVTVEIAWDGGFRIPMADWTWTDVSDYVELVDGINGSWGRGDQRSTADANTLTLTFDNSDGRFTAGRITSPYYPDVVLYRPIRVLADPVDGTEAPLFTGYITSWPVEWEDTSAYAKATITAASRLARLGLNARFRSIIEETYLADSPVAYYPLGDPEGSTTAADLTSGGLHPLTMAGDGADVAFGQATGPGTDGLTAATFAVAGKYLRGELPATSTAGVTIELFFNISTVPTVSGVLTYAPFASIGNLFVGMTITGRAAFGVVGVSQSNGTTNLADGATHHVVGTWDGTTRRLYVDGVEVDNDAIAGTPALGTVVVGSDFGTLGGVAAHVAIYDTALSAARVAAHTVAGFTAGAGETTDARFLRYAAMAGIDSAEVDAEAGATTMGHIDTTDQNVVDLLRITETTEAGVVFDALDGILTLHGRGHRYGASSVLTLDMALDEVEADYSPRLDASFLVNDITVAGVTTVHKVDEASIAAYGLATASLTTASEDDDEPRNLASWALLEYAQPKPRVPSLSVDVTNQAAFYAEGESTVSSADLIAVTIGDKITVANHPSQAALSITDYFVEGGTFSIGPESFKITWNVSPSYPYDSVLIVDDPVFGDFETYPLAL